jgi:hypothetical protein
MPVRHFSGAGFTSIGVTRLHNSKKIHELENLLTSSVINSDQQCIFTAVKSSFRKIFNKQNATHIRKFSVLTNQQNSVLPTPASTSKKLILHLSEHILTDSEESVLRKGLNFSVTYPHSNLDMACAVKSIFSKPPQTLGMEFRWKIGSMLQKSKSSRPIMTTKELRAVKSLSLNIDIRILQADKGNCTVVSDETKYKDKSNTLLEFGVYEPLPKDSTAKVDRKIQKLLSEHKTTLPINLKHKLTSTSIWPLQDPQTGHSSEAYSEF